MKESDTFSFLVASDLHLGYKQDDPIRGEDSFLAFAEALRIARERQVDFVLLGGDLFHRNRPSSNVEHQCIGIIRQHVNAGNGEATFRRIHGDFSHSEYTQKANFEEDNLKIRCPIMTIHGNHDDPTGPQAKSVCEKLATCGLLNYFGFHKLQNRVKVSPLVFQKNSVKIALYGMGFIPDLKLRAAFDRNEIEFIRPPGDTFNILVVHQNRVAHVRSKYIPDNLYPDFIHLLIRGHEHDAMIPTRLHESRVDGLVYQPGSTVATSIAAQEASFKKVAVMSVKLNDPRGDPATMYKLNYDLVPLDCARRIILTDISRREFFDHIKATDKRRKLTPVEYRNMYRNYVKDCIEKLIKQSQSEISEANGSHESLKRGKPLLKIRLEYKDKAEKFDDLEVISAFYPQFVANRDIISFRKQKIVDNNDGTTKNVTFLKEFEDEEDLDEFDVINLDDERRDTIETMIESYFNNKPECESLTALSLTEYTDAVRGSREDGNVISKVLANKKSQILKQYRAAVSDELVAEEKFNTEDKVSEWFIDAFKTSVASEFGGDEADVIMLDD